MEPDDLFELPLPFALKSKIISESPTTGADMTLRIPENVFTWFADRGPVTIMVNTMPPRDPNDDDDEEEEDEEDEEDEDLEPPVVREPDPDE
jgi:hypothetical protein